MTKDELTYFKEHNLWCLFSVVLGVVDVILSYYNRPVPNVTGGLGVLAILCGLLSGMVTAYKYQYAPDTLGSFLKRNKMSFFLMFAMFCNFWWNVNDYHAPMFLRVLTMIMSTIAIGIAVAIIPLTEQIFQCQLKIARYNTHIAALNTATDIMATAINVMQKEMTTIRQPHQWH